MQDLDLPNQAAWPLAIITGASSGIGREVAALLARRGYRTLLLARRTERLERLAQELSALAPSHAAGLDLADESAVDQTLPPLLAAHGPADVLINNAGYGLYRAFLDHTPADHHRLMQVNYFAAMAMTRLVLPGMIRQGRGHIINIASMSSKMGPWGHTGYAAAKAALVAATQTLAAEHGHEGVRLSYVNPGIVSTDYFRTNSFFPLMKRVQRYAISSEYVAQKIVGLLDRPRLELCIPRYYRILDWIRAISPGLAHWLVARNSRPMVEALDEMASESARRKV